MKNIIFLFILGSLSFRVIGQEYSIKSFDLTDSLNKVLTGSEDKSLQKILIEGFKSRKLRAYTFPYRKEPIYGPMPQWPMPKAWSASGIYDKDDSVVYKNKLYRFALSRAEFRIQGPTIAPDAYRVNDYWIEYKRAPSIKSYKYTFPSTADIMTVDKWEQVKKVDSEAVDEWNKNNSYYQGDRVSYGNKIFEALTDNSGKEPGKNQHWQYTLFGIPTDNDYANAEVLWETRSNKAIVFSLTFQRGVIAFYIQDMDQFLKMNYEAVYTNFGKYLSSLMLGK